MSKNLSPNTGASVDVAKLAKGAQTRAAIIDTALSLAAQEGLDGLSLGMVALAMGMSKSGVFAHFGSREELQCSVVREYHERFEREIFVPALHAERGLARLLQMVAGWMGSTAQPNDASRLYGSLYISGAVEFDDRPGDVRDALALSVSIWMDAMRRAIVQSQDEGQLVADVAPDQVLFELHGIILSLHYETRFLHGPHALQHAAHALQSVVLRYAANRKRSAALVASAIEPLLQALPLDKSASALTS
ncbi:MAG: TetR/AcrR family transcriptional regulator [Comamonas sp.]